MSIEAALKKFGLCKSCSFRHVCIVCDVCNGTGISDVVWHQDENGNSEQEPIKCEKCDGLGEVAENG